MKTMLRVALVMGLMTTMSTAVRAEEIDPPTDVITTQILVMNNYLETVRVYLEDANGKLHSMGLLARGSIKDFTVPEAIASGTFRVKVYPAAMAGTRLSGEAGVKTNPLESPRDQQVRVWLEPDLPQSTVEIARD